MTQARNRDQRWKNMAHPVHKDSRNLRLDAKLRNITGRRMGSAMMEYTQVFHDAGEEHRMGSFPDG